MTLQNPTASTKALIPPVVLVLLVVLASIFYSLRHPNQHSALTDMLIFYSYAAVPHVFGLALLLCADSRRALAAGFLVVYWFILGGYLLFIRAFIFSAESLPRGSEFAWVLACGLSVWIIISGSTYRRLDRRSFSTGIAIGAIFTISVPILLAMAQRTRH